jgi:hypothetical protein
MKRYLVIANRTLGGEHILQAIRERAAAGPAHFHVLVPNTRPKDIEPSWVASFGGSSGQGGVVVASERGTGASPEEIARRTRRRLDEMLDRIKRVGAEASGEIGDPDPVEAVARVLDRQDFDEILVSMFPARMSRWLRLDLPSRIGRKFQGPVIVIEASA